MIIGHKKQWQFLKKSAELGKLSHAYLFSGQAHLGKKTIAFEFVKLVCASDLLKREHPDLIFIKPENQEIPISQIRELNWRLALKPYSAPFKIAIIDQAHLMTSEAQNALLKTLEEPKGNTLLILITYSPQLLFPTILSRCEIIKFYQVKNSEIENYLKTQGFSGKTAKEISQISLGRPGIAIDFSSSPQKLEDKKRQIFELLKITRADFYLRFQYAKKISGAPLNLKEVLEVWLIFFRNALISRLGEGGSRAENFNQYSIAKLKNILKAIQSTNFFISTTNINQRLALEVLMLEL